MKTLRLKSILFGLMALFAIAILMTSCEQESLKDITEQIEDGHGCSGCMMYSTEEPDEMVDVLIQYSEDSEPVYEKAARYGEIIVYGGDVVLTQNYSDEIALRGTVIANLSLRWDNSTIPYTFGGGLSAQEQAAVLSAIEYINNETNLCVVERTNEADYIVFEDNSSGCYVFGIGNSGGAQTVNLGPGCGSQRVIVHEVLHKAGFFHEQVRPDRNNFITVNSDNFDNSQTCWSCQFNQSANAASSGAYDFASIMHYPQFYAPATINDNEPMYYINPGVSLPNGMTANQIGWGSNMSATDIAAVNSLYPSCGGGGGEECDNDPVLSQYPFANTYVDANNCTSEKITVYNKWSIDWLFVETPNSSKLYRGDTGQLWCTNSPGYDCVAMYGLTNPIANWECCDDGGTEPPQPECDNDPVFSQYPVASTYVNENNCTSEKITVYNKWSIDWLFIETPNSSRLYRGDTGQLWCTNSPGYDCVAMYGLTNPIANWECCN